MPRVVRRGPQHQAAQCQRGAAGSSTKISPRSGWRSSGGTAGFSSLQPSPHRRASSADSPSPPERAQVQLASGVRASADARTRWQISEVPETTELQGSCAAAPQPLVRRPAHGQDVLQPCALGNFQRETEVSRRRLAHVLLSGTRA